MTVTRQNVRLSFTKLTSSSSINLKLYCLLYSTNSLFNADLALSVTMTAISTILSIGMLPLNVFIYSKLAYSNDVLDTLDWTSLGISLIVVVTAITLGIAVSYKYGNGPSGEKIHNISNTLGNVSGLGLILFTGLFSEGGRISLSGKEPIFYYGTIMPIVLGLLCSVVITTLSNLKKPERVTVSTECVYQNTSIAMTSCLALFSGDDQQRAVVVPFWYTGMQTSFVGVGCLLAWKFGWTYAPPNANIVTIILKNYQNKEGDSDNESDSDNDNDNDNDDGIARTCSEHNDVELQKEIVVPGEKKEIPWANPENARVDAAIQKDKEPDAFAEPSPLKSADDDVIRETNASVNSEVSARSHVRIKPFQNIQGLDEMPI